MRAPTCVWGARHVDVVPCAPGRLLRFDGAALHSVPRPTLKYLQGPGGAVARPGDAPEDDAALGSDGARRQVLLFNTWPNGAPLADDDDEDDGDGGDGETRGGGDAPDDAEPFPITSCAPRESWTEVALAGAPRDADAPAPLIVGLMGDRLRRGRDEKLLVVMSPRAAAERALSSRSQPTRLPVDALPGTAGAEPADPPGAAGPWHP